MEPEDVSVMLQSHDKILIGQGVFTLEISKESDLLRWNLPGHDAVKIVERTTII